MNWSPLFSLGFLIATANAGPPEALPEARTVSWQQLQPQAEFEDPYEKLDADQLIDLSILARVQDLEERDDAGLLTAGKRQEAAEARARLEQQGIDIDGLLDQREEVDRLHLERASAAEQSLVGRRIRLPGYLLPIQTREDRVTEFLLVPWVGACIHTPPPPPNQMVHVTVPGGIKDPGRFAPIWIEGELALEPGNYQVFLVDGRRDIEVAYSMSTDLISAYSSADSNLLAQVEIPDTIGSEHSWLQRWQIRAELLFTKAMADIQASRASGPMLWGLLVAFLYGILHTLGPGHGKAVVAAYFVGERGSLWRGLRMGGQIALFHVLSAVIVVVITYFAVRQATGQTPSDYRLVRLISYGSIIGIGGWMLFKAVKASRVAPDHHHHHEGCGCAHLAQPAKGVSGLLSLAVGAVPCTGALIVLLFGLANDLLWPSITLVIAISLGMAIALSGVGVAAILGRRFLDRRLGDNVSRQQRMATTLRIGAAAGVFLIGCLLFAVTW